MFKLHDMTERKVAVMSRLKTPPNGGRWSDHEHRLFLQGIEMYGKDWRRIARLVQTRTTVQTRSHAQKHFDRLEKEKRGDDTAKKPPVKHKKAAHDKVQANVMFPPRSMLEDQMFQYLHGPPAAAVVVDHVAPLAKPSSSLDSSLPPPIAFMSSLDYFSFASDVMSMPTATDDDQQHRQDVEFLLEDTDMSPRDLDVMLESKDLLAPLHFLDTTPRSHTPQDDGAAACEPPSMSPMHRIHHHAPKIVPWNDDKGDIYVERSAQF
ncbi:unnamed protein product [Aphanomyces euteiches]